jgi:hypothetical protein
MTNIINRVAAFVSDPLNVLIFFFLWVGVALVGTDGYWDTKGLIVALMAIPAFLGYKIGRRK